MKNDQIRYFSSFFKTNKKFAVTKSFTMIVIISQSGNILLMKHLDQESLSKDTLKHNWPQNRADKSERWDKDCRTLKVFLKDKRLVSIYDPIYLMTGDKARCVSLRAGKQQKI